ncbi:MAG: hypothetical protein NZ923_10835 [Candidatus Kryptonium sp.]|nr:hypothetical protein [Candidatus Kryptonium sp.]
MSNVKFQSLTGAIQTLKGSNLKDSYFYVSIPHRCDSNWDTFLF